MTQLKQDIKKALETGLLYDFISRNYHKMTTHDLAHILLEIYWSIYELTSSESEGDLMILKVDQATIKGLEEMGFFDVE